MTTCCISIDKFAFGGALLASHDFITALHGRTRVACFSKPSEFCFSKEIPCEERVRDANLALHWAYHFVPPQGKCRTRLGAGGNVGYVEDAERSHELKNGLRSAADETLDMLGWPALCEAVARFASTTMGKELCHGLTPPPTKAESQALQDETSAALEIDSILGGVLDFGALQTPIIKGGLDRISRGMDVSGQQLAAIATLLQVALALQRGIAPLVDETKGGRKDMLQPISQLVEPMVVHQESMKFIWSKIDEDGTVKDTASPQLRQARIQARTVEQRLQELLNKLAREKSSLGDQQEVIDIDGRLCLTVTTGTAGSVPGLLFQRGNTAYLEPSQAVSLNSRLADARLEVQSAERAVLSGISIRLRPHLADIQFILHIIIRLDVIAARGKYSSWIGGRKPLFVEYKTQTQNPQERQDQTTRHETDESQESHQFLLDLRKARHPLLVEKHRHAVKKAKAKLKGKTKALSRLRVRAHTSNTEQAKLAIEEAELEVVEAEARAPVPIDVKVSAHTRVVAITGPNAGGKTAAIKAVGLAAVMAKVGLYVLAADPVYIPWFDAVFADIGDEQSLGQSLSTFSGHLLRIKRILTESTDRSLVLLDELSAGTDPTEGAALGMALLESFAEGRSLLTLATTHHGELKTLKYSDDRFENACVEFDNETLAPTYKLLWGIPGRSNALNVARRQGLPSAVLEKAEGLYGAVSAELNEVIMRLEGAKVEFDRSREESEVLAEEVKEFYSQLVASAKRLDEHNRVLHLEKCEQLEAVAGAAHSRLRKMAKPLSQSVLKPLGEQTRATTKKPLEEEKEDVQVPDVGEAKSGQLPGIGQVVFVAKLGREAKVVGVNVGRKEITVQSGFLQIKLDLKDVQRS